MSQGSLFSTRFTLGLAAYLVGAASLSSVPALEPFPAVILPGGGDPVRIKDGVAHYGSLGLWGRAPGGEKQRIVVSEFLNPIPDYYLRSIAGNGFGSTQPKPQMVKLGPFDLAISPPERSKEARSEVGEWLKGRLRRAGLAEDRFFVRRDEVEIELTSDRELRRSRHENTVRVR